MSTNGTVHYFMVVTIHVLSILLVQAFRYFDTDVTKPNDELTPVLVRGIHRTRLPRANPMPTTLSVDFNCGGQSMHFDLKFHQATQDNGTLTSNEELSLLTMHGDQFKYDSVPRIFSKSCRVYRDTRRIATFLAIRDPEYDSFKLFGTFSMKGLTYFVQPYNGTSTRRSILRHHVARELPQVDFAVDTAIKSGTAFLRPFGERLEPQNVEHLRSLERFRDLFINNAESSNQKRTGRAGNKKIEPDPGITEPLKRQEYEIEVILVCDYLAYLGFQEIYGETDETLVKNLIALYFSYLREVLRNVYKSILTAYPTVNLDIQISVPALFIASSPDIKVIGKHALDGAGVRVNSEPSLYEFANWIQNSGRVSLKADHYALITGHDLYGSGVIQGVLGQVTRIPSVCEKDAVSVNELTLDLLTTVLPHEIGHSLGAKHDSLTGGICNDEDFFIMAATVGGHVPPELEENLSRFSFCSVFSFASVLPGKDCVSRKDFDSSMLPSEIPLVGQRFTPDQQCQFIRSDAMLCRAEMTQQEGSWDRLCSNRLCTAPGVGQCFSFISLDFTSCGHKRWCESGQCVDSSFAPERPIDCPAGDQADTRCDVKDCNTYDDNKRFVLCCETCKPLRTERFIIRR